MKLVGVVVDVVVVVEIFIEMVDEPVALLVVVVVDDVDRVEDVIAKPRPRVTRNGCRAKSSRRWSRGYL